jgi:opacity protein-like surface antigen
VETEPTIKNDSEFLKKVATTQKQMKKILISAALLLGLNSYSSAQGFYANLNLGYGFGMSSQNLPDFYNYKSSNSATGSFKMEYEQVDVSFGKGINLGGSLGYMFNKNIGAELGLSYLIGGKSKASDSYASGSSNEAILSAKMFRFNPSLLISSGLDKINPYAKMGIVIGSGTITYEYNEIDIVNQDIYDEKWEYNGGVAIGLSSAIGVMFSLSDNISFFSEVNMINLSYAPQKGELVEANFNGVSELPFLTTSEKEIEFVKNYTSIDGTGSSSQPDKQLSQKMPFGSVGLNFGIKFNL